MRFSWSFLADAFIQQFRPFFADFFLQLGARAGDDRKFVAPLVRARRVDQRARAEALLLARDRRVERAAPAAVDDLDRARRVAARAERPDDFVGLRDVNVVVDHDDVAPEVRPGAALARDHRGLAGVAGIALADREHG